MCFVLECGKWSHRSTQARLFPQQRQHFQPGCFAVRPCSTTVIVETTVHVIIIDNDIAAVLLSAVLEETMELSLRRNQRTIKRAMCLENTRGKHHNETVGSCGGFVMVLNGAVTYLRIIV